MQDVQRGRAVVVVTRREWLLTDWSGAGALSHAASTRVRTRRG